jgi:hypothetical protein
MLEVHDPGNCEHFLNEPPEVGGGLLDYSTERCAPDRPDNPTMLACGSRGTGTRVYDVRDILHPKEIAYWKGPAPRTAFLPGSGSWSPGVDRTVEKQAGWRALSRFLPPTDTGASCTFGSSVMPEVFRYSALPTVSCRRTRVRRSTPTLCVTRRSKESVSK